MRSGGTTPGDRVARHVAALADAAGTDDGALLGRFLAARDEPAFAEIVRRHGPMVLGVCRRVLGNRADADDAFQAVFLVLARKAAGLADRPVVGDWLHGVARRTALRARTTLAVRRRHDRAAARPEAVEPAEPDDRLALLDAAVAALPEKYRRPVVLCDLEGWTRAEAARALGWPEGTVAGRLARARALLARRLPGGVAPALAPVVVAPGLGAAAVAAAAGRAPAPVVSLAEGTVRAMLLSKLRTVVVLVLAAGVCTGSAGLAYVALAADPPPPANSARDPSPPPARPPAELTGTWRGEKDGVTVTVTFRPAGRVTWQVSTGTAGIGADLIRSGDEAAGPVHLRFDAVETATRRPITTTCGRLDRGDNATLLLTILPAAATVTREYPAVEGIPLRRVADDRAGPAAPPGALFGAGPPAPVWSSKAFGWVRAAAFAPDGRVLATGGSGDQGARGRVRLWDAETGRETGGFDAPLPVATLSFSADGSLLAVGGATYGPGDVTVFTAAGRRVWSAGGIWDSSGVCAFDPAGKAVAFVADFDRTGRKLRLVAAADAKVLKELDGAGEVRSLAFAPDGKTLALGTGLGEVWLWDPAGGAVTKRFHPNGRDGGYVSWLAYTPDGKTLLVGQSYKDVRVCDPATGAVRRTLTTTVRHEQLAVWPDGRTLAAGPDVFDLPTGERLLTLPGLEQSDRGAVAVSRDGRRLATGPGVRSGTVAVWAVAPR